MTHIDATHRADLRTWVPGADGHADYPVQNLPLCAFSTGDGVPRGGTVIGDYVLDHAALAASGLLDAEETELVTIAAAASLNGYCALPVAKRRRLRATLSTVLSGSEPVGAERLLVERKDAQFHLPAEVGDYTDFFAGIHHARNAGRMFRPDNPLLPNYKHVPIAYHGRASSVLPSGAPVVRPAGQRAAHGATVPDFGPSTRLDFELELAIWIGGGNAPGETIPIERAGEEVVGFGLLNDWSARDIQAWETQPLGPFLGKNFLTTVSPFLVTAEALAPFRTAQHPRDAEDPEPLPYLQNAQDQASGAFDIQLEVLIATAAMREGGLAAHLLTRASTLDLYWTPAQMLAHHASNGCPLRPGDLFGTGTVSSPAPDGHGSLLEMTKGGREPVMLPNGEVRTFLEPGDEIILRGRCIRPGFATISLGEASGIVTA
ncbi:fumarylacetoacetase [Sphingomonas soli]|uniref:fumarylacetoacetase n=1 Tax=Sphingomonas soli TaxID=266127 RepID=UPI00082D5B67|nr:fumarylacetoacetase [Sphingomonas soli]